MPAWGIPPQRPRYDHGLFREFLHRIPPGAVFGDVYGARYQVERIDGDYLITHTIGSLGRNEHYLCTATQVMRSYVHGVKPLPFDQKTILFAQMLVAAAAAFSVH